MTTAAIVPKPARPNKVPANSPFVFRLLLCPECGQVVRPSPTRMGNNKITSLTYYHKNPSVGCGWKVMDATRYAEGQLLGLRENVPDGVDRNGRPKFLDEYDLADGTSFDLNIFTVAAEIVESAPAPEPALPTKKTTE